MNTRLFRTITTTTIQARMLLLILVFNLLSGFFLRYYYSLRERMDAYFIISLLGTVAFGGILLLHSDFPSRRELLALTVLTGMMLVFSLLFHDDYFGGECGFHVHLGYPLSWLDGSICVSDHQYHFSPNALFFQYPKEMGWHIDPAALIGDALLWLNASLPMVLLWKLTFRLINGAWPTRRNVTGKSLD